MSTAMIMLNKEIIHRYTSMLNNKARNEFYYNALKKYAKDKVVIDVGTGTGILAAYALEHGAKFVYAVEGNRNSANMAQNVLGKCFDQSRFKVINTIFPCRQVKQRYQKDTLKDIIKTKSIDLYVGELIGADLFDEDQVDIWDELNEYYFRDTVTVISPSANPNAPLSPKQLREIEALDAKDAKDAKEKEVANTSTETPLLNELIKESATYVSPIEADIAPIPPVEPQIVESIANPVPIVEDPTVNTNNTQLKPASEAPNSFDSDGNPVLTKEELELEEELQDDIDIEAIKKACLDAETKQKKGKK